MDNDKVRELQEDIDGDKCTRRETMRDREIYTEINE